MQANSVSWSVKMQAPLDLDTAVIKQVVDPKLLEVEAECPQGMTSPKKDMETGVKFAGFKRPRGGPNEELPAAGGGAVDSATTEPEQDSSSVLVVAIEFCGSGSR